MNKAEIKRMDLDLPEGQREQYPATSAGYCLRRSSERSERAATKGNGKIKIVSVNCIDLHQLNWKRTIFFK